MLLMFLLNSAKKSSRSCTLPTKKAQHLQMHLAIAETIEQTCLLSFALQR